MELELDVSSFDAGELLEASGLLLEVSEDEGEGLGSFFEVSEEISDLPDVSELNDDDLVGLIDELLLLSGEELGESDVSGDEDGGGVGSPLLVWRILWDDVVSRSVRMSV